MTRRREPEPVSEQDREDEARREDQARSDAESLPLGACSTTAPCAYMRAGEVCTFCHVIGRRAGAAWEAWEFPEWAAERPASPEPEVPADQVIKRRT